MAHPAGRTWRRQLAAKYSGTLWPSQSSWLAPLSMRMTLTELLFVVPLPATLPVALQQVRHTAADHVTDDAWWHPGCKITPRS